MSDVPAPVLGPLPDTVRVSVVVPALHAAEAVPSAVASALSEGVDEVVVAAGDPETEQAVARIGDGRVRVVPNPSGRTSDGLNRAIEASSGEVVVRLDAHAQLDPGYVATAVATLRSTGAPNGGGRQPPQAGAGFARAVAIAMTSRVGAGGATYRVGGAPGPVDTVYLGVFRRDALEAVGGFDPRFTRNQDAELNLRLRGAGYLVWFDPRLAVTYRPRDTIGGLARQYFQYGRWRRLTVRTHPGSASPRQLAPPGLVAGLLGLGLVSWASGSVLPFALGFGAYLVALTVAAAASARPLRLIPAVVVALATMHLAWGTGFLLGPPRSHREAAT